MAVDWKEEKLVIAEEMAHQWLASEVLSALHFNLEGSSVNEDDPTCDATFLTSSRERNLEKQQDCCPHHVHSEKLCSVQHFSL